MELYKRHRPKTLKGVVGNKSTVATLKNMLERKTLPHTILFHGPSGAGKTTLARILKTELECHPMDFQELNCSSFRGIDTIRDIERTMSLAPVGGKCKIWLLDEFHQMSKDGMNASLKILEDTPAHVYFLICTTDPQKLLKTIRTRCSEMPVEYLEEDDVKKLLLRVAKREKITLSQDTIEEIYDASEGSARKCLVLLDKVKNLPEEARSNAITCQEEEREGIELCRALIEKNPSWSKVSKLLREITADPESLRWSIMGYCSAILLKKADDNIYRVLTCFENHFYDSKKFGLVSSCYEAVHKNI